MMPGGNLEDCRHGSKLTECTLCLYDLPAHMRDLSTLAKRNQAAQYLRMRYRPVTDFGGGRRKGSR